MGVARSGMPDQNVDGLGVLVFRASLQVRLLMSRGCDEDGEDNTTFCILEQRVKKASTNVWLDA